MLCGRLIGFDLKGMVHCHVYICFVFVYYFGPSDAATTFMTFFGVNLHGFKFPNKLSSLLLLLFLLAIYMLN